MWAVLQKCTHNPEPPAMEAQDLNFLIPEPIFYIAIFFFSPWQLYLAAYTFVPWYKAMSLFDSAITDIAKDIVILIRLVPLQLWLCFSVPESFFT